MIGSLVLRLSGLFLLCCSDDGMPLEDTGDLSLSASGEEASLEIPSMSLGANELFRDRAPMRLFSSLNSSIQPVLGTVCFSEVVVVAENSRAFSRIMSLVSGWPFFSCVAWSTSRLVRNERLSLPGSLPKRPTCARYRASALSHV